MAHKFKVGDHVSWNVEVGHVSGRIIKVHIRNVDYKGYTHHATVEDPQYKIKSDKNDHIAMHKETALKKYPIKIICRHHYGAIPMSSRIKVSNVRLKRAYEPPVDSDGTRVLVDRLWPRGVKKVDAALDHWAKDLAPSTALRKWFAHDPSRWPEFLIRYAEEVRQHGDQFKQLRALARTRPITLVYSAHDEVHNDAVALRDLLLGRKTKTTH